MRSLSASLMIAALSLLPAVGSASPVAANPMQLAQYQYGQQPPGWWEQEGHGDELRDRYNHLPPRERFRYDQLESQIRDLQGRQEQLRREQRRILRWGG